ncbi:MAG TPA: DnaJ domain-containing protein [Clostridia bacterium]|nr:DnaJ domain-containing protein [Clostridia bacterium]
MERRPFSRRKSRKKEKTENLYKILGTRSNIGQGRIKEKYIEKVKEFPPETHPEEFQDIRRAYEVLRDVNKRKQYDLQRKYGGKLEKIMEDAASSMSEGKFEKAAELMDYALEMDPDNTSVRLTQAELFLDMEDIEKFYDIVDRIMEECDIEDKQYVLFIGSNMLYTNEYYDEALAILEKNKKHITDMKEYHKLRIRAFLGSDDFQQAWGEFKYALPSINNLTIENLNMLTCWLNIAMNLGKWGEISKIQNYIRKLSKMVTDEEELFILRMDLLKEAESYVDVSRYREADIFMQLASQIFRKDTDIQERRKEIQPIAKLEKELDRLFKDREMIPYVSIKIEEMFAEEYFDNEYYDEFLNNYPHEMMEEQKEMKEDIAYGILRVKKKYPSLYKKFNKELTEIFNESTKDLNREQRRRLK